MSLLRHVVLNMFGGLLFLASSQSIAIEQYDEYEVKIVAMYNLARFVEWSEPLEKVTLCIWGKDVFGDFVRVLDGSRVGDKLFFVKSISKFERGCNMVFISPNEELTLQYALQVLKPFNVLTISDLPQGKEQGVMVNLIVDLQRQVRFDMNYGVIKQAKLNVGSKLLRLGNVLKDSR